MGDLVGQLLPEMLGLVVTPAAVVGSLLLLGSSRPWRNLSVFAATFLFVYTALAAIVWSLGRAAGASSDSSTTVKGWVSIALGTLFLAGGVATWIRSRHPEPAAPTESPAPPGWASRLVDPPVSLVLSAGLLLSIANPNVAILASGVGVVLTAGVDGGDELVGILLLLGSSMIDFVVPAVAFAVTGPRGRAVLRLATRWLLSHNQVIGVMVLVAFGLLFLGRGLVNV